MTFGPLADTKFDPRNQPAARVEQPTPQPKPCQVCGTKLHQLTYTGWGCPQCNCPRCPCHGLSRSYVRECNQDAAPAAPVVEQREQVKACATIARSVIANGVMHTYSPAAGWCCEEGYKAFASQRTVENLVDVRLQRVAVSSASGVRVNQGIIASSRKSGKGIFQGEPILSRNFHSASNRLNHTSILPLKAEARHGG